MESKYLLDTHVWLWMHQSPEKLSMETQAILKNTDIEIYLSVASMWEIGLKYALGKLKLNQEPQKYVLEKQMNPGTACKELPILPGHVFNAASLPMHHRDPFDRLLIAQTSIEGFSILTVDKKFETYDVKITWADA